MTLDELIPTIVSLSHADKFRLVQIVLQQLAEEDGVETQQSPLSIHASFLVLLNSQNK